MEIRVLQYFLAVAREQNIMRASEALHLSQPTLSRQIMQLEDELGTQLLIRGKKGSRKITLTEEGMILRKRAEEILELIKKTENEITISDNLIIGDVHIGSGETKGMNLIAKAANLIKDKYPGIHYHLLSGNATYVKEQLNKGLIDFGIIFEQPDLKEYESITLPYHDTWGVLMPNNCELSKKEFISPKDLWDKPLIISQEQTTDGLIGKWLIKDIDKLNIIASYNLLYNASIMVKEGLGYALCFDGIINTDVDSSLCFKPLNPAITVDMNIIWKRYQIFSKPAQKFLQAIREVTDM